LIQIDKLYLYVILLIRLAQQNKKKARPNSPNSNKTLRDKNKLLTIERKLERDHERDYLKKYKLISITLREKLKYGVEKPNNKLNINVS